MRVLRRELVDLVGRRDCTISESRTRTKYAYDALHRATSITYPSGPNSANTPSKHFIYDSATVNGVAMANAKTRLAEAYTCVSPCSTKITDEGFCYTVRGEVSDVYESTPHSGGYFHSAATYWANGVINSLTASTGYATNYNVDGEGRVYSAGSGGNQLASTTYNTASQPTIVTFASLDSDSFTYDPNTGRMTQYQYNVNGQSVTGALTWNANGTMESLNITDPFNAANTQNCSYTHDDLVRIASANCGSVWSQTFGYDAFGNITKTGSSQFHPTYSYATNQMSSIGTFTPTYDSNGDVLNDALHSYAWDAETRPTTIDTVAVSYDALERMVEENKGGVYTQILYSPTGFKMELMNGQSSFVKSFVPMPGGTEEVWQASGASPYYRHSDWLGSSRFASTTTRTMYNDLAYAPFGEQYAQAGSTGVTDTSFAGNNEDTTTNLYDAYFREYGIQGRWPSPDPAGVAVANPANPQSWNRYAYALNNPLGFIDPLGLGPAGAGNGDPGDPCAGADACVTAYIDPFEEEISEFLLLADEFGQIGDMLTPPASPIPLRNPNPGTLVPLQPQKQSYADCVKNSGNEASVQGLLGLDNSKIAGAFLGNPFSDGIQFVQNHSAASALQASGAPDMAAEAGLKAVPNVAVSYSSTTVVATPSELTVVTTEIQAVLPLGEIATGAADLLGAFGKIVTIPVSVTATAFGSIVCAAGR